MFRFLLVPAALWIGLPAMAQIALSSQQVASYDGLHRAPHAGDLDAVLRALAEAGADMNALEDDA